MSARLALAVCALWTLLAVAGQLAAAPALQLYLEGGTYNTITESWELTPPGSSGGAPFRLWAIGNTGAVGSISNVRLSVAYSDADLGLSISLTSSTVDIGEFPGIFQDVSLPASVVPSAPVTTSTGDVSADGINGVNVGGRVVVVNGSRPVLGNGKPLPAHGIYGLGTVWQEFGLGDFTEVDSRIGDFIDSFPTDFPTMGQINVYDVSVTGGSGASVHFDLYDTIVAKNHAKFAPFSHDADGDANIVPEPASIAVWSLLIAAAVIAPCRRLARKNQKSDGFIPAASPLSRCP